MMSYFLAKTDPATYSIEDLEKEHETVWDGVHNFQAINFIKSWQIGDRIIIYHSQKEARVVGLMEVVGTPYKDPRDKRNISWVAKVRHLSTFPEEHRITLKEIKHSHLFPNFLLVTHSRLSVMPCPPEFVKWLSGRGLAM